MYISYFIININTFTYTIYTLYTHTHFLVCIIDLASQPSYLLKLKTSITTHWFTHIRLPKVENPASIQLVRTAFFCESTFSSSCLDRSIPSSHLHDWKRTDKSRQIGKKEKKKKDRSVSLAHIINQEETKDTNTVQLSCIIKAEGSGRRRFNPPEESRAT